MRTADLVFHVSVCIQAVRDVLHVSLTSKRSAGMDAEALLADLTGVTVGWTRGSCTLLAHATHATHAHGAGTHVRRPRLLMIWHVRIGKPFAKLEEFELATAGSSGDAFVRAVLAQAVLLRKKGTGKATLVEISDTAIPWEIVRNLLYYMHWALEPVALEPVGNPTQCLTQQKKSKTMKRLGGDDGSGGGGGGGGGGSGADLTCAWALEQLKVARELSSVTVAAVSRQREERARELALARERAAWERANAAIAGKPLLPRKRSKFPQASICKHGRRKYVCKDCGGSSICEHGRHRYVCKDCGGDGICKHGRQRRVCKDCGGSSICKHGRQRSVCKDCKKGRGVTDSTATDQQHPRPLPPSLPPLQPQLQPQLQMQQLQQLHQFQQFDLQLQILIQIQQQQLQQLQQQ